MNKWGKFHYGLVITLIIILIFGYYFLEPSRVNYPPYLSFSPDKDGVKALRTLMEKRGFKVDEWSKSWMDLPAQTKQTLLVIQVDKIKTPITAEEEDALQDWFEQGNQLVVVDDSPTLIDVLFEDTDIELTRIEDYDRSLKRNIYEEKQNFEFSDTVETSFRLSNVQPDHILFSDKEGALAAKIPIANGNITIVLTPEWLQNGEILQGQRFEAIWPYLQHHSNIIWFDEYHHGISAKPGILAVYPDWLVMISIQLIITSLIFLWFKGKRFGPIFTPRSWIVRRGDETLVAVASWYETKNCTKEALAHQFNYLQSLMIQKWGLTSNANQRVIIMMAKSKWEHKEIQVLEKMLKRLDYVNDEGKYSKKHFVQDSYLMDQILKVLERE